MLLRRRDLALDESINDYITNGIVLWLDGKDKGNNTSVWPDRCGNYNFNLNNCTFTNNGVVFNGSNSYGSNKDGFGITTDTATIEYCVEMDYTNGDFTNGAVLCPTQANSRTNIGACIRYQNDTTPFGMTAIVYLDTTTPRATPVSTLTNKIIFSGVADGLTQDLAYCLFNGEACSWTSQTGFAPNNSDTETTIGCRHRTITNPVYNMLLKGIIHSIRVYNRKLTTQEMLVNQRVDNKRFNFGLTI